MQVFVFKYTHKKLIFFVALIFLAIMIIVISNLVISSQKSDYVSCEYGTYYVKASNNTERIAFLEQFGWNCESTETEISDVVIPCEFSEIFESYNKVQQSQGLDLANYKGQSCTRFTYKIVNYPEQKNSVYADILIKDNRVIGGDICSSQNGGFLHNFFMSA